jgi:hypothetical protein
MSSITVVIGAINHLLISTYYMLLVNYNKHSVPADLPRVNKSGEFSGAAASICQCWDGLIHRGMEREMS